MQGVRNALSPLEIFLASETFVFQSHLQKRDSGGCTQKPVLIFKDINKHFCLIPRKLPGRFMARYPPNEIPELFFRHPYLTGFCPNLRFLCLCDPFCHIKIARKGNAPIGKIEKTCSCCSNPCKYWENTCSEYLWSPQVCHKSHTGKPLFIKGNYKNNNYHKYFFESKGHISFL